MYELLVKSYRRWFFNCLYRIIINLHTGTMFTTAEKELVETWRGHISKAAVQNLKPIKVKYTGQPDNECGCSSARRKVWLTDFFNWYDGQDQ